MTAHPASASEVLAEIARFTDQLRVLPAARSEKDAIDRIQALETLTSAADALKARETLTLDMLRRNSEACDGVPTSRQGKGLGAEIGLARRVSRSRGSRLLAFARTLLLDLPHTYEALKTGIISEEKAQTVANETSWLSREKRQQVDEDMVGRLGDLGVRQLGHTVRALAQQADQPAAVEHLDKAVTQRRITVRPAPGNMAYLTALLPLPQAVAAYANLTKSARTLVGSGEAEGRTESQVAADLLVERVTGQDTAAAVPTEIHLVMDDEALLGEGEVPAWLSGHGPVPAAWARRFVAESPAGVFVRRLFTRPSDGLLVGMDSRRREFSGLLRRMIVVRDGVCRSPWCDAPIRHADHAVRAADGGVTSWSNASGLCAACNFVKESGGWTHEATPEGLRVITPTGHNYTVATPPLLPRLSSDPPGETVRPAPSPPGPEEEPAADAWGGDPPAYEHEDPGEVIIIDEELGEDDAWPIPGRHVPRRSPEYESAVRAFREWDDFGPMREWMNGVEGQASAREARGALSLLSDPAVLARRKSQADLYLAAKLSAWRAEHPERPQRPEQEEQEETKRPR